MRSAIPSWSCSSRRLRNSGYNKLDRGGHFAAWEQPGLISEELRAAFKPSRSLAGNQYTTRGVGMKSKRIPAVVITVVSLAVSVLAVLGVRAVTAQDTGQAKYSVRVPNGLAFSEFRGYESWQTVAISHNEKVMAVILANPVMIKAYQSGIPGNGKPFPDGSKMAKVHWNPKKLEALPTATVPASLHDVDFMVKDSKRFADSGGWDGARSTTTPRPIRSRPPPRLTSRRRRTTPSAGSGATRS